MKRSKAGDRPLVRNTVYVVLGAIALVQATRIGAVVFLEPRRAVPGTCEITVHGRVRRPGRYRVPRGTTHFEILRTAGLLPGADVSPFVLSNQVAEGSRIGVDSLEGSVTTVKEPNAAVRLEFFFGELSVIARDGRSRPQQEGMGIEPGDRILMEARSQAEVSVNTHSRVDLDAFTELVAEKIGVKENGKDLVELYQRSGVCWYRMVYSKQSELFRIVTPLAAITVAGQGTDCMIDVSFDRIEIHNIDGLLLVEKLDGGEAINLISGQTAFVFDDGRPIQVKGIAPDVGAADRFSQLTKEKTNYMLRHMPLNFLFCGIPSTYILVSVQFESGTVRVVQVPPHTAVDMFVDGIATLDQAHLQGGPVFASTLLERIVDARITRYCVFDRESIRRTVEAMGGILIDVDEKAASALNISAGAHTLSGRNVVTLLKPSISGWDDSRRRQQHVLRALFKKARSRGFVLNAVLAARLLSGVETNFTAPEVVRDYKKLVSRRNWTFRTHTLPTKRVRRRNRVLYEPTLEQSRNILFEENS